MPNAIKYSTSAQTLALKKGNFYIGTGDVGKGPTSSTDYWNGITPPAGGYTIYLNKASGGPSIYTAANDAALISLTNSIAGASYTTVAQCLEYYSGQSDKLCVNQDYDGLITDGLVFLVDSGYTPSYPTTSYVWYDLTSNARNVTLYNAGGSTYTSNPPGPPTFSSSNGGIFSFSVDDWGKLPSSITAGTAVTFAAWVKITDGGSSNGIMSHCSGGPVNLAYVIAGGKMRYWYYTAPWQIYDGTSTVNDGNWKYLVWAKNGTNMVLYINGTQDASTTLVGNVEGPLNCVGSMWGPCNSDSYGPGTDFYGQCFNGTIATVQVYNKQLSAAEIQKNFNAQKSRFGL